MTDRTDTNPSKGRGNGAISGAARRISFASLDLQALERDLDGLPARNSSEELLALPGEGETDKPLGAGKTKATGPAGPRANKANKAAKAGKGKAASQMAPAPDTAATVGEGAAALTDPVPTDPMEIVARHGRLLLRLSAATEGLEARYRELAELRRGDDALLEEAREEARQARQQARRLALESVRLMDALDWVYDALSHRGDTLAAQVASARRDCMRHLAAVGITEVPADGRMDGRLHEGLESVAGGSEVPQYHIVSVVRRGYQLGSDVLRRTEVTTAE